MGAKLMTLKRKSDWAELLIAEINKAQKTPFKWGEHDCALFVADVILAMTDVDLAADLRGTYSTYKGSLKVIKKAGFKTIQDIVDSKLENIEINQSIRGDVICVRTANGPALAINAGLTAAAASTYGIESYHRSAWLKAWSI